MSVNPDIITWAREHAGYRPSDVLLRKHFPKIGDWESGLTTPTYPQLEKLAEKLKVPVAAFFFPARPYVEPIQQSFRTLPSAQFDEIPPRIRLLLRKAKAFQLGLAELNLGRNPAAKLITREFRPSANATIEEIAANIRMHLGVSFQDQFEWRNNDVALKAWRRAFYGVGVYIFKDAFGRENEEYSGFSLHDDEFPIVFVNNSTTLTRQIFTVFHELAHLLFRTSGLATSSDDFIDELSGDPRRIEIVCNEMAAKTLVPDDFFDEVFEELFGSSRAMEDPRSLAEDLANRFCVSREMIYRKFLDRKYVVQEEYLSAAREWNSQQSRVGNGGNKYYTWLTYLGREYISLAFTRYYQGVISFEQLGDILDIKPRNLEKLEDYLVRSGA